jgi:hypothetical protein
MKLIEGLLPDPTAQANAKIQLQQVLNQASAQQLAAETEKLNNQASVVKAEVGGQSAAQRNWRPYLMYLFMIIIANNYIVFPFIHMFFPSAVLLPVPEHMWTLLDICVGGYVGGRSLEKIASVAFDNKKFFDAVRKKAGKLTQEQVDSLNDAIKAAEE